MISYSKALSLIEKNPIKLKNEKISIINSINRVSAENIFSPNNNPLSNNAAFDGFAILSRETKNLSKKKVKKFKILKTIAAGDNPKIKNYKKNSVVEVMTGGLIPKYYDSILPVEKAKYYPSNNNPTHLIVSERIKKFSHVRFAGEDYKKKDIVLKKGELIQPKHLMAFTVLGIKEVKVKKKPKIIFYGTGNEIVDYNKKKVLSWQVRNSNNHYFTSFGKTLHYQIIDGGLIKDREKKKLKEKLKKTFKSDIDIFVTSGAISAGKFDFIPKIISELDFKMYFKGVYIKPGRPIMLSKFKRKEKLFFGLPGNPISCAAGFRFFIYPLIRNSLGMLKEKKFKAKLVNKYSKRKNFTHFARCLININSKGTGELQILQKQQSHRIESFVKANCWGIFPSGKKQFKPGDIIEWVPLIPSS
ncbi:MAG: molybdopterin molybdenumtransferase MoeA [Candidatus Pelagibacterales bacterium]|nr:MAG: molybdopterin molybdenumtransferase MoeA [Pelagibacterales bacterium]